MPLPMKEYHLYLPFQPSFSTTDEKIAQNTSRQDSMYVVDLNLKKIIKSVPVGAGPRNVIKNPNDGKLYVCCDGSYIL